MYICNACQRFIASGSPTHTEHVVVVDRSSKLKKVYPGKFKTGQRVTLCSECYIEVFGKKYMS